jgi:hypothetical protein
MSTETPPPSTLQAQWEDVRLRFFNSLLVDTSIHSLIQNLEMGATWPLEGEGEVPSKYIDFTWEEVNELPGIADQPERLALLITVLEETIAFDDPFGEMVTTVENATDRDNALERTLEDLEIPADFPLRFGALSEETLAFCEGEDVSTVGEFVQFAERMAQSIFVGGDFQATLNALVTKDEATLARYLPYRPQEKGVHLVEAIGLMVARLSEDERHSLLKRYGYRRPGFKFGKATLDREALVTLESELEAGVRDRANYFKSEVQAILVQIGVGICLERRFVVLDNEEIEYVSSALLARVLKLGLEPQAPTTPTPSAPRGFFARLFARI